MTFLYYSDSFLRIENDTQHVFDFLLCLEIGDSEKGPLLH